MDVGFFGKIPTQPDFVRSDPYAAIVTPFVQWVQSSVDRLKQAFDDAPAAPVRFIFSDGTNPDLVAGIILPSHDAVGRKFPLVIYVVLRDGAYQGPFSALPVVCHIFIDRAEQLAQHLTYASLDSFRQQLALLPEPSFSEWGHALQICERTLQTVGMAEFQSRVFGDSSHALYAYQTILEAARLVESGPPEKAHTVFDCPMEIDVDLFAWLELTRRALRWRNTAISFCWIEEPSPRLLVALGPLPVGVLSWLKHPEQKSDVLWPLITKRTDAIERARSSIASFMAPAVDAGQGTLGDLCALIESRGA